MAVSVGAGGGAGGGAGAHCGEFRTRVKALRARLRLRNPPDDKSVVAHYLGLTAAASGGHADIRRGAGQKS
jgi:hypothetical protein